nr:rhabdomeric opsin [Paramacrobiotus richtersi]
MKSAMTRERAKLAIACVWTYRYPLNVILQICSLQALSALQRNLGIDPADWHYQLRMYNASYNCADLRGLVTVSVKVLEGFLTTCTFDYLDTSPSSRSFIFSMFCGAYVASLLTIIACYLLIIWEVYRHAKKFKAAASRTASGKAKNEEEVKKKKEVKTAKIAALIIACWVLAWTPYAIVALMGIATNGTLLTPIASQLPALFCKTAAVYNPIGRYTS